MTACLHHSEVPQKAGDVRAMCGYYGAPINKLRIPSTLLSYVIFTTIVRRIFLWILGQWCSTRIYVKSYVVLTTILSRIFMCTLGQWCWGRVYVESGAIPWSESLDTIPFARFRRSSNLSRIPAVERGSPGIICYFGITAARMSSGAVYGNMHSSNGSSQWASKPRCVWK